MIVSDYWIAEEGDLEVQKTWLVSYMQLNRQLLGVFSIVHTHMCIYILLCVRAYIWIGFLCNAHSLFCNIYLLRTLEKPREDRVNPGKVFLLF